MAYRQLCAMTLAVLGLAAVGCGGDTNSQASSPEAAQQPPSNPDQPPGNSDQASGNSDQAPSNPDRPVNNANDPAGTGGGGRIGALCQELCSSLDRLSDQCDDMPMMGETNGLCSTDCQVPPNILPCEQEITGVFSCLIDNLQLFCPMSDDNQQDPGPGRPPAAASPCQDILRAYTTCAEAHGITDDDPGDDNNAPKCSTAGGCDCPSDCMTCTCEAGTNTDALAACADACAP